MNLELTFKDKIICVLLAVIFILLFGLIITINKKEESNTEEISMVDMSSEDVSTTNEYYYVDIKGAVKKPGVYKVDKTSIVNDVISLAGGLKSNAYTLNINLSQQVKASMVIYIYTKSEIKKTTNIVVTDTTCKTEIVEINNCIEENTTQVISSKINLNTATKEELMTLSGVGESKALAIIEYRNSNKFEKIEDIMNVSGIGESAFAKIKDNITV